VRVCIIIASACFTGHAEHTVPHPIPSANVNFQELARCTDDFNGAQCKAVCVEAVCRGCVIWGLYRATRHRPDFPLLFFFRLPLACPQGMIALRREATEVHHEDYMEGRPAHEGTFASFQHYPFAIGPHALHPLVHPCSHPGGVGKEEEGLAVLRIKRLGEKAPPSLQTLRAARGALTVSLSSVSLSRSLSNYMRPPLRTRVYGSLQWG
jgi:hypothetical protein